MEQQRVDLGHGIALDVVDTGPREAPTLIFLHGFPESHRTWRHQIAHFSRHYRCIAPDQRGYRGSSKPQEVSAYTPDKLIGDVFRRVERAVIANAPHPAIFQRLLYLDRVQREASQYMRGFRDPANDDLVREQGLVGILLKEVRWDRPSAMEPAERDALLKDWQDRDAAFGMLNWYRASPVDVPPLDAPYALPEGWSPPALPKLTIPTLVIWAMDDLALPPENLQGMDEIIPDLTLEEVHGCGHFVPWEAPDAVNAAMERFLSRTG
jgi:pimeloyl-ACP methyl ester carboxylesterase